MTVLLAPLGDIISGVQHLAKLSFRIGGRAADHENTEAGGRKVCSLLAGSFSGGVRERAQSALYAAAARFDAAF